MEKLYNASWRTHVSLFHKHEIDGCYEAEECNEVIPMKWLSGKHALSYYREDDKTDNFLYYLQLDEVERTAVVNESDTVGWHLTAVLKEGDAPWEGDGGYQRPVGWYACLL